MRARLLVVILSLLLAGGPASRSVAQSAAPDSKAESGQPTLGASSELDLKISATQTWTDTGLELHPGDVLEITSAGLVSASTPQGTTQSLSVLPACRSVAVSAASAHNLQLSSAPLGALVGKLHKQGGEPFVVEKTGIKIEEQGHLFLAINAGSPPACQEILAVKVRLTSAVAGQTTAPPKDMKTKLAAAAQTWIAGQFGTGASSGDGSASAAVAATNTSNSASTSAAVAARALNISTAPLDPKLRDAIDHLPRRVNDQLKNLGDMVNFVVIGSQKDVQDALQAANWLVADTSHAGAVTKAILMTYENKDYLQMPMSELYLFGRVQDFGYEQAEPYSVIASRHHFRLWKAPFQVDGQDVWVGAGTHDVGFETDQRNGKTTHKIDPAVDRERDQIATSLEKTGHVAKLSYYLPANPVQQAKNATGGEYHSDGRILVMWMKAAGASSAASASPQ
jgi:hypothetical protein